MTGQDLQQILLDKWGVSYDMQLRRMPDKIFLQVMWKYLEQASFPMSQTDYLAHLDAIADYLNSWESADQVKTFILNTREKPRLGKAVSIPLDLGSRSSEWLV
ncbi:MAG: DUF3067 family protein [Oscillatoriales cyanobacterium RM2_1_1]|nr:DUF3067 family protein [Oscillatoriales cyanobacterium SM2_3_0]NJO44495.1 DUF3067 family protein [Oscillatoriales cyanobacterium RM2_1_1]